MTDHSMMKLGKRLPKIDPRTPRMARLLAAQVLPAAPAAMDYSTKLANLGIMLNDKLGDCTCAAVGHRIQTWTSWTQPQQVILPDSDILALYEKFGYVLGQANTDNGACELDVLDYWFNNPISGHALAGYGVVRVLDHVEVQSTIWIFGGAYIGISLPVSAQSQDVWDVPSTGSASGNGAIGSWGGHAVDVVAYDADGLLVDTWGILKRMTWNFWDTYVDEAYGLLSQDWMEQGKTPEGFDWPTMQADMQVLKNG